MVSRRVVEPLYQTHAALFGNALRATQRVPRHTRACSRARMTNSICACLLNVGNSLANGLISASLAGLDSKGNRSASVLATLAKFHPCRSTAIFLPWRRYGFAKYLYAMPITYKNVKPLLSPGKAGELFIGFKTRIEAENSSLQVNLRHFNKIFMHQVKLETQLTILYC